MRMTKKVLSIVLAVMMVVSMMSVMAVSSASALDATDAAVEYTNASGSVSYLAALPSAFNSGTYKLLQDVTRTTRMTPGIMAKDVTLDLNGYTLTSTATDCTILLSRGGSATSPKTFTIKTSKSGGKIVATNLDTSKSSAAFISCSGKYNEVNITGGTITSNAGIALLSNNETLNVSGGTFTVDGNDFAIATNGSTTNDATINITGGTVKSTGAPAIYLPSDGTLNISGGTITGTTGIYLKSGTTNITAGTINGTGTATDYKYNGGGANATGDALVVDNCGYPDGEPQVTIKGGTFTSTNAQPVASYVKQDDPTQTGSFEQIDEFIEAGTFKSTNGTVDGTALQALLVDATTAPTTKGYTVVSDHVAVVEGVYYDTFAAAVASADAQAGKIVTILKTPADGDKATLSASNVRDNPIRTSKYLSSSKYWNVPSGYSFKYYTETYDGIKATCNYVKPASILNTTKGIGYNSLSSALSEAADGDVIDLTEDFTPTFESAITLENKKVTFNLNGHTIKNVKTIELGTGSELIVNGAGTITSSSNGVFLVTKGKLTIKDATVTTTGGFVVAANGSAGNNGYEINIVDATLTTTKGAAIYQCNAGDLNISGDDTVITGPVAVYIKSGDTTITGGTFNATGDAAEFTHNGNGINPTGDAIVVENCGYPGGDPTVSITDGKFVSENADAVASYAYGSGNEAVDEVISGGEFSSDVSDLVVTSKTANKTGSDSEAPFVIENDTFVAQVGDVKYDTVSAAIDAAQAGDTVKLLKDVTGPVTVTSGKDITLDLNGKTISGGYYGIVNNGTLTVEGSGTVSGTYGVRANANSSTTINGGTFNAQECAVATFKNTSNATITINDGTFTTVDNSVLSGNGSTASGGNTWNINGGTFNGNITSPGYIACGIYAPNDDTWNVNGGTFNVTNGAGIVQRGGKVIVGDDVVIKTTGTATGKVGDAATQIPCAALVYDDANYPGQTESSIMTVKGGNFESEVDAIYFTTSGYSKIKVSGGTFSSRVPNVACATSFVSTDADEQGKYTVEIIDDPLDPFMTKAYIAQTWDHNQFNISNDYHKGTLLGVQKKNAIAGAAETSASGQETGKDIRFVAVLDTQLLKAADDYGFVLAKVGTDKDTTNTNFDNLKANWGNGEKTVSAKGTYNNVCGSEVYGNPTDSSTNYKYITCAVNGLDTESKVVAKFYVTIGGKTYYAQYAAHDYQYRGVTAGINAVGAVY